MDIKSKLAIFDMDGTLFDTRRVNYSAYTEALKNCGLDVEIHYENYCDFCNGNSYKVFLPQIIKGITEDTMQRIHEEKKQLYSQYLFLANMNVHLFNIIELIRAQYQIALVTTASLKNATDILKKFEVSSLFDFLVTQEDVIETKPNPECFIKAIDIAGVSASDTIIFEDSETGLKAAELSGAKYVKVYGYN